MFRFLFRPLLWAMRVIIASDTFRDAESGNTMSLARKRKPALAPLFLLTFLLAFATLNSANSLEFFGVGGKMKDSFKGRTKGIPKEVSQLSDKDLKSHLGAAFDAYGFKGDPAAISKYRCLFIEKLFKQARGSNHAVGITLSYSFFDPTNADSSILVLGLILVPLDPATIQDKNKKVYGGKTPAITYAHELGHLYSIAELIKNIPATGADNTPLKGRERALEYERMIKQTNDELHKLVGANDDATKKLEDAGKLKDPTDTKELKAKGKEAAQATLKSDEDYRKILQEQAEEAKKEAEKKKAEGPKTGEKKPGSTSGSSQSFLDLPKDDSIQNVALTAVEPYSGCALIVANNQAGAFVNGSSTFIPSTTPETPAGVPVQEIWSFPHLITGLNIGQMEIPDFDACRGDNGSAAISVRGEDMTVGGASGSFVFPTGPTPFGPRSYVVVGGHMAFGDFSKDLGAAPPPGVIQRCLQPGGTDQSLAGIELDGRRFSVDYQNIGGYVTLGNMLPVGNAGAQVAIDLKGGYDNIETDTFWKIRNDTINFSSSDSRKIEVDRAFIEAAIKAFMAPAEIAALQNARATFYLGGDIQINFDSVGLDSLYSTTTGPPKAGHMSIDETTYGWWATGGILLTDGMFGNVGLKLEGMVGQDVTWVENRFTGKLEDKDVTTWGLGAKFTLPLGGQALTQSDARLKRDVTHLTTLENGLKLYSFKYLWDETVHVGLMAQDLLADENFRHAVVMMPDGFYAVNYRKLGLTMATLEQWNEAGLASSVMLTPASIRRVSSFVPAAAQ